MSGAPQFGGMVRRLTWKASRPCGIGCPPPIAADQSMHARLNASLEIVYLLRHGETECNRAEQFEGRLDSPLTDRGTKEGQILLASSRKPWLRLPSF